MPVLSVIEGYATQFTLSIVCESKGSRIFRTYLSAVLSAVSLCLRSKIK